MSLKILKIIGNIFEKNILRITALNVIIIIIPYHCDNHNYDSRSYHDHHHL